MAELCWENKNKSSAFLSKCPKIEEFEKFFFKENLSNNHNLLIYGDNKLALNALLKEFSSKVDLIYIDPPFDIGSNLNQKINFFDTSQKKQSLNVLAYSDIWKEGKDFFLQFMYERVLLCKKLLRKGGAFFFHCDYRTSSFIKCILDEVFCSSNYVNEIIWHYKTGGVSEKLGFGKKHDTIHYYVNGKDEVTWNPQKEKSYLKHKYGFSNIKIYEDKNGSYSLVNCRDVFLLPALRGNQPEKRAYPTQKPEALLKRLILAASNKGDLVLDCFSGSGSTLSVCSSFKRRWIGIDSSPLSINCIKNRVFSYNKENKSNFGLISYFIKDKNKLVSDFKKLISFYNLKVLKKLENELYLVSSKRGIGLILPPFFNFDIEECEKLLANYIKKIFKDSYLEVLVFFYKSKKLQGNSSYRTRVLDNKKVHLIDLYYPPLNKEMKVITDIDIKISNKKISLNSYKLIDFTDTLSLKTKEKLKKASSFSLLSYWGVEMGKDFKKVFTPQYINFDLDKVKTIEDFSFLLNKGTKDYKWIRVLVGDIFGNISSFYHLL